MRVWRSGRKPPKCASKDSAEGGGIEDWPLKRFGEGRVVIEKAGMAGVRYLAYTGRVLKA